MPRELVCFCSMARPIDTASPSRFSYSGPTSALNGLNRSMRRKPSGMTIASDFSGQEQARTRQQCWQTEQRISHVVGRREMQGEMEKRRRDHHAEECKKCRAAGGIADALARREARDLGEEHAVPAHRGGAEHHGE